MDANLLRGGPEEIARNMGPLSDVELLRIVTVDFRDYLPEAVVAAREVLCNRGVQVSRETYELLKARLPEDRVATKDSPEFGAELERHLSRAHYARPVGIVGLLVGAAVFIGGKSSSVGMLGIYLATLSSYSYAWSEWPALKFWRKSSLVRKFHAIQVVVFSLTMTFISVLGLMGVIDFGG